MSRNGELLLKRVVIEYNQVSGVGHSMRHALAREIPLFKAKYPSVVIDVRPRDKGNTVIAGIYKDGSNKVLNTFGFGASGIAVRLHRLVNTANGSEERFGPRHLYRQRSSIQGNWTPWLWSAERHEERVPRPAWDRKLTEEEWDHYVEAYGKQMLGFEKRVAAASSGRHTLNEKNTHEVQQRWREHVQPYLQTDVEENLATFKKQAARGKYINPVRIGEYKLFEVPEPTALGRDVIGALRGRELKREADWWKERQEQLKPPL